MTVHFQSLKNLAVLEADGLVKTYDRITVVNGVTFSIGEGEIVGLVGPNGAGKTTVINMILGLVEPTKGEVRVLGKDFGKNRSEILSKMNFAASYAQLPGNLTAYKNLLVYSYLYNVFGAERKIAGVIEDFGLGDIKDKITGLLSTGEQMRLLLAKAMLNSPKLLLLDEPTSSLDPDTSDVVVNRIKKYVKDEKASVLWTSHDMYEIEALCDRLIFISNGSILMEGNPKELVIRYGKKNLEELFISTARNNGGHSP